MIYDILIVGAGPSGSYLAYLLSKNGYKVKIIDKENFPRNKVCGGGISNKTVELLDFDISAVIQKNISGAFLSYQNKNMIIKHHEGGSGVTVLRRDFDNFILDKAIKYGAEFQPSCSFISLEEKGDYINVETSSNYTRAKYLIGADGVFSRVRNKVFGKNLITYAPSLEALVYVDKGIIESFENRILLDFGGMNRGYGWIFPKSDHLNVGVFSIYGSRNIKGDLERFMKYYKSLENYKHIEYKGFSIPLKNKNNLYEKGNVWLTGDAAGFAESFYGEGIYFALKSALVAYEALSKSFELNEVNYYSNLVKDKMIEDLFYSELNARLFFPFQKFGYFNMVRSRHVNYYFAGIISGGVSYKECFYNTLLTLPYWILSEKLKYADIYNL
jgi:geranylgeranyl reductase family protein